MRYNMSLVEKAKPEVRVRYESIRQQWEAAVAAQDALPKEERGEFTKQEFEAGAVFQGAGVPPTPRTDTGQPRRVPARTVRGHVCL